MKKFEKIACLADIHVRKMPTRNNEYETVFNNLIVSLEKNKPDIIVICGDLVHEYLNLQPEQLILINSLLNNLANIAPVRIIRGNHDFQKSNPNRTDSIEAIIKILNNSNIIYYNKTNFFEDNNIIWAVWRHGEKNNNPWKSKEGKKIKIENFTDKTFIDLFHDPIIGCKTTTNFEIKSKLYYKINDLRGQYSILGDIHLQQYLNKEKTKFFVGSLIAQDVTEGDNKFHGYLILNIKTNTVEEISIFNNYSFKNIHITPYTDFDDLDIEIPNPTKYMKVRFVWITLPQTRTKENERKIIEYIKSKYANVTISHKNEFLETEKIDVNENIVLENITDKAVQQEIFKEFLIKVGTNEQLIKDVIALDDEILNEVDVVQGQCIEWDIIKFGAKNFRSYEEFNVDWQNKDGLFQICGSNTNGKTTIYIALLYCLFGKSPETDFQTKFGDSRYVNNKNNANFCEVFLTLMVNGEYYGIKRKTEIIKNKSGEITSTPTTLNYYVLTSPNDEMNDSTSLEKLDDDNRIKTQKKLNEIIGTYDNFMRVVTTSDSLNKILSNTYSIFIDSLLFDSGLDIFDKKLEGLKVYQKRVNEKSRISCNVEANTTTNLSLKQEIIVLEGEVNEYEIRKIPEIQEKISTGRTYVETLTKKLFKIDPEIYVLSVDSVRKTIGIHTETIKQYNQRKSILEASIASLRETYNAERLKVLLEKKESHKTNEYNKRLNIKSFEQDIRDEEHQIEIINGEIFRLKQDGAAYKKEALALKEGKNAKNPICPLCKQEIVPDHLKHIDESIAGKEKEMFRIAEEIKTKETVDKKKHQDFIDINKGTITAIRKEIETASIEMEDVLNEIGTLTNEMNDVSRRKELQAELDQIPMKIQNEQLKIDILQQKIDSYENSLLQIEENHKIEKGISAAKEKILLLEGEEQDFKEDLYIKKTEIGTKSARIKANNELITAFTEQEYRDSVMNLYKKCVHRDGIPKQILTNHILPKINLTLENILSIAPFKVWLSVDDLRPKLAYNNTPNAIIDCISASGKERTFSSVVLKFALNQINVKAKPTIFLLDEVMGKLDEDSTEEFIEILQLIKNNMKKVLIIEHLREINPDYLISVSVDENRISSLIIE